MYGSWIYNYLCNQCISPLKLWVLILYIIQCILGFLVDDCVPMDTYMAKHSCKNYMFTNNNRTFYKFVLSFKMKWFWVSQLLIANRQERQSWIYSHQKRQWTSKQEYCISFCNEDRNGSWQSKRINLLSENSCQCYPIIILRTVNIHCRVFSCHGPNFSQKVAELVKGMFLDFLKHNRSYVIQIDIINLKVWFYSETKRLNFIVLFIVSITTQSYAGFEG